MFDNFTLLVVLLPLGSYLIVVGWLNSQTRPIVVSGSRDVFALGLSCVGLVLVGPFSLFFPQSAFNMLGGWVWLVLLVLYLLILSMIAMAQRPRIVIYSADSTLFVEQFAALLRGLDEQSRWAGLSFYCPQLQIEGNLEIRPGERAIQVISSSRTQNLAHWSKMQRALQAQASQLPRKIHSVNSWLVIGAAILIMICGLVLLKPDETLAAMREMLRF